jgi:UDP-glucose 6-dehydrogenase
MTSNNTMETSKFRSSHRGPLKKLVVIGARFSDFLMCLVLLYKENKLTCMEGDVEHIQKINSQSHNLDRNRLDSLLQSEESKTI